MEPDCMKYILAEGCERCFKVGDIVQHFKHELTGDPNSYRYEILAFATHSETGEELVVYKSLNPPYYVCARPLDMFVSEVDHEKYPDVTQRYRLVVVEPEKREE